MHCIRLFSILCLWPSATRTRRAVKRHVSRPLVPRRQLTLCHLPSPALSEQSVYPSAHGPAPCAQDHLSSSRAGTAASPPSPAPPATPTLARLATDSWPSFRATRHIVAQRQSSDVPPWATPYHR